MHPPLEGRGPAVPPPPTPVVRQVLLAIRLRARVNHIRAKGHVDPPGPRRIIARVPRLPEGVDRGVEACLAHVAPDVWGHRGGTFESFRIFVRNTP